MLDQSSLSQLRDLKKQIHDSTIRITGEVKGTKKRFGFVVSEEDKQEYLLPQTEMERVLPGDKIQCILEPGKNNEKPIARVEKFFESTLTHFIGKIKEKNKQLYVIPDHPQLTRWIFIPPKSRKGLDDGDLVGAKICQHPFKNKGRVQADITHIIGKESDPFIEHRFYVAKYQIPVKEWQQDELDALRITNEQLLENEIANGDRQDRREQCFVTIDGAMTQDLDDALSIEKTDEGFKLFVAIADASTYVDIDSPLDRIAKQQMSSIYLPAQKLSMLPDILASNICSLKEGEDRLALCCIININSGGQIIEAQFENSTINSKGKLSYDDVESFLQGNESSFSDEIKQQLSLLDTLAKLRTNWRKNNSAEMPDYPDYRLILDDNGKMTGIEHHERNSAQKLVEECMLACNSATAEYLHDNAKSGLFIGADGFKPEQLPGLKRNLEQFLPEFDRENINTLEGYLNFQKAQQALNNEEQPDLFEVFKKKLKRTEWQSDYVPHFGLGFTAYTTFTSPIRKYSDLVVHRLIKRLLKGKSVKPLKPALIEQINELNNAVRGVQRDCELSLKCQFLSEKIGESFTGSISMINHRQIGVYWKEYDVHGQVDVRSLNREYSFSQDLLTLDCEELSFKLGQELDVKLVSIDNNALNIKLEINGLKEKSKTDDKDKSPEDNKPQE